MLGHTPRLIIPDDCSQGSLSSTKLRRTRRRFIITISVNTTDTKPRQDGFLAHTVSSVYHQIHIRSGGGGGAASRAQLCRRYCMSSVFSGAALSQLLTEPAGLGFLRMNVNSIDTILSIQIRSFSDATAPSCDGGVNITRVRVRYPRWTEYPVMSFPRE